MENIRANFELNKKSLKEFIKILIPELIDQDINIIGLQSGEYLELKLEAMGRTKYFIYKDHSNKIFEQKLIMSKIGLLKLTNKNYPWGGLIGVRPTKLVRRLLSLSYNYCEIENILCELYDVSLKKSKLLISIVKKEMNFLNSDYINMYIGIPYCPTKCSYCSFASYEARGKIWSYYSQFVTTLLEEIEITGKFLKNSSNKIESIYIGGGTPSILTEEDLKSVLTKIKKYIDLTHLKEFTFEAGRVDTITLKKLEIMKSFGVNRISLNPQSFNLNTLYSINRSLDIKQFRKIFNYAEKLGFIINMDLILGLPGENTKDILYTLEQLKNWNPENITIHTLALKKASTLYKKKQREIEIDFDKIYKKLDKIIEHKKMEPYYMYRQKNSVPHGENIGFSTCGTESIFNIQMIEENQSTIGLGGGAITKLIIKQDGEIDKIKRLVNPKEPVAYIMQMRTRLSEKLKLFR